MKNKRKKIVVIYIWEKSEDQLFGYRKMTALSRVTGITRNRIDYAFSKIDEIPCSVIVDGFKFHKIHLVPTFIKKTAHNSKKL